MPATTWGSLVTRLPLFLPGSSLSAVLASLTGLSNVCWMLCFPCHPQSWMCLHCSSPGLLLGPQAFTLVLQSISTEWTDLSEKYMDCITPLPKTVKRLHHPCSPDSSLWPPGPSSNPCLALSFISSHAWLQPHWPSFCPSRKLHLLRSSHKEQLGIKISVQTSLG